MPQYEHLSIVGFGAVVTIVVPLPIPMPDLANRVAPDSSTVVQNIIMQTTVLLK